MLKGHKGFRALVALAGMAGTMFVAQLALATPAQAICYGSNNPETLTLEVGGVVYASETPKNNSCENANGTYSATVRSHRPGWRVGYRFQDSGDWTTIWGPTGTAPIEVSHYDSNATTRIQLCADNQDSQNRIVYCGYGTLATVSTGVTNTYSALNEGY